MKYPAAKHYLAASVTIILIIVSLAILAVAEEPQDKTTNSDIVDRYIQSLNAKKNTDNEAVSDKKSVDADFFPELLSIAMENKETKAAMYQSLQAYYAYRTKGFEHRKEVFAWQLFSAKIIFFVVIFLVLIGVYFSWVQFHKKMESSPLENASGSDNTETDITTFSASAKEIKVSSPVLGVIILVISLVFFYLYLIYVFPIEEIM